MKKPIKKLLSLVIVTAMIMSTIISVFAETKPNDGGIHLLATNPSLNASESEQQINVLIYAQEDIAVTNFDIEFKLPSGLYMEEEGAITSSLGEITSYVDQDTFDGSAGYASSSPKALTYDNSVNGYVLLTLPVIVPANTPAGEYNISFTLINIENAGYDNKTFTYAQALTSATITVTEPAEEPDYELYYKLNSTTDTGDKYFDYTDVTADVVADIYIKAKEATTLQAYDIYVTNSDKFLGIANKTVTNLNNGLEITDSEHYTNVSTDTLTHIQAIGKDTGSPIVISLPAGEEVRLATITYKFNGATAAYGDKLGITIRDDSNIAIISNESSFIPTIGTDVLGAELLQTYTITYNDNVTTEEIAVPAQQTRKHNETGFTLSADEPVRTGYKFKGWSATEGGTTVDYDAGDAYDVNANLDLYAVWEKNTYTVIWKNGNAILETDNGEAGNGAKVEHGDHPVYNGSTPIKGETQEEVFEFAGWSTDPNAAFGDAKQPEALVVVEDNTTYYAIFKSSAHPYTVSFDLQGHGEAINARDQKHGDKIEEPLPAPSAEGYTFGGWYKEADCTNAWDFANETITGDTVLYAKWTANQVTVTLDGNGGTPATDSITVTYDEVMNNLPTTGYTRDGYTFTGKWNTKANGTGTEYDNTSVCKFTEAITLYAVWEENTYTIRFDPNVANGGSTAASMEDMTGIKYTEHVNLTQNILVPADEAYRFASWNTQPNGSGTSYQDKQEVWSLTTENNGIVTLYAQWTQDEYQITYILNGGTMPANYPTSYRESMTEPLAIPDPTRVGYEFLGWTGSNGDTNQIGISIAVGSIGNKEYVAHWEGLEVEYKVNHHLQNATGDGYTLDHSGTLTGKVGDQTAASAETITGFTALTFEQKTIEYPANTTVIDIYYDRNTHNVTFEFVGAPASATVPAPINGVRFGASIAEPTVSHLGYDLTWDFDFATGTMPDNDLVIKGTWTAQDVGYTVKYFQQKVTDTDNTQYDEVTADAETIHPGFTDAMTNVTAQADKYEGFAPSTVKPVVNAAIAADGSTVINVYYDRLSYNVTYEFINAPAGAPALPASAAYRFGAEVNVDTTTYTKNGYAFSGWNEFVPTVTVSGGKFTMPASDVSVKGTWTVNEYTLTFDANGGSVAPDSMTYTIESAGTLPTPTNGLYTFLGWRPETTIAADSWTSDALYNGGTPVSGKYGSVKLVAEWQLNINYRVEDYKYAPQDFMMLRIENTLDDGKVYTFDGGVMYLINDENYNLNGNPVFVALIHKSNIDIGAKKLTAEGGKKLDTPAGVAATVTYDGNVNGDANGVNIADANAVYQMVRAGGDYYASTDILTIERRLSADMYKVNLEDSHRGSIEDVNAIVDIINGKK